jgi:heme A synthase
MAENVGAGLVPSTTRRKRERSDGEKHPAGIRRDRTFRWFAVASAIATYGLIVFGGIVRVTESGLGCPDWPLCYGQIIPPLNGPTLIEYTHRLITSAVTPLLLITAFLAWRRYRDDPWIIRPALAATGLLAIQIVLGGVTVLTELHDSIVSLHLANAMLILALLVTIAMQTLEVYQERADRIGGLGYEPAAGLRRLAAVTAAATFGLVVIGAQVRGTGAGPACMGFPACGNVWLPNNWLAQLHMLHRVAAVAVGLLVIATAVRAWRLSAGSDVDSPLATVTAAAVVIFLAQFTVGIAQVTLGLAPALRALHLALATALWADVVVLAILVYRPGQAQGQGA